MQGMFKLPFSFFSSFFKILSFKSSQTGQILPRIHTLRSHQQESTPKTSSRSTQNSTCFPRSPTRRLNCHQLLQQHGLLPRVPQCTDFIFIPLMFSLSASGEFKRLLEFHLTFQRQLYAGPMSKLRLLMIRCKAKPKEVLIVEDKNRNIARETMKDNDILV
ncbi:Exportin-1, repeat 2 [Dillenia turbinata]|uniref:Exportin-1, repeat 2 n=1 Tax=Dillenia turbinata TaxID=194707 RepID=A0AAN8UU26_9MAGN